MAEQQLLLKQEAERLMQIKGNSRGEIMLTHSRYIRYKEGEEGLKAVEEKMKELGYPIRFKKINALDWYPEALSVLVILVAREIFEWNESDIFNMGNTGPKYSLITKMIMKYFFSLQKTFAECPRFWQRHYDFGALEPVDLNEKEKHITIRVKGYKFHPIVCVYYRGYFLRIAQFVLGSEKLTIEETKCMFRNDPYHEYLIKWV